MFKIKNFNIKRRLSFPLWLSTDFKEYVLTQNITEIKRIIKHFIKEIIVDKEQVKIVLNLLSFLMGEITEQLEEEKMIVEREELYTQLSKKYIRKRS